MNAKQAQKWIARNAPDFMLVRRDFVKTLQRQKARLEDIERAAKDVLKADGLGLDRLELAISVLEEKILVPIPRATDKNVDMDSEPEDELADAEVE